MKRIVILMIALMAIGIGASAQSGLEIEKIFGGKYISDPTVTETMMSGDQAFLRSHKLNTFATFKGRSDKYVPIIQPLVVADGAHARARNVRYRDGKLHFAYYVLPPVTKDGRSINRYLCYLNNEKAKNPSVMVIYFDGAISNEKAEALIKSLAK